MFSATGYCINEICVFEGGVVEVLLISYRATVVLIDYTVSQKNEKKYCTSALKRKGNERRQMFLATGQIMTE